MKPDRYNPKIPIRNDGHWPADWLYPECILRVHIAITPIVIPTTFPTIQWSPSGYGCYKVMYHENDFETPYNNTLEVLRNLMMGPYVVIHSDQYREIVLYCNEWLNDVVIKLAQDANNPTGLDRVKLTMFRGNSRRKLKANAALRSLFNKVN